MQEQWNATLWQFFSVVNSWPSHLARTLTFPQSKGLLPKRLPPALALPTTLISPTSLRTTLGYDITYSSLDTAWQSSSVFAYPLDGWFISPSQLKHAGYYNYKSYIFRIIWSDLVTYRYIHMWHMWHMIIIHQWGVLAGQGFHHWPILSSLPKDPDTLTSSTLLMSKFYMERCLKLSVSNNIKKLFIAARVTS